MLEDSIDRLIEGLQLSAPLLYIMARSGTPWSDFGFTRPRVVLDGLVAGLIFLLDLGLERLACPFLQAVFPFDWSDQPRPSGTTEQLLFITSTLVSAFEQELFSRAYLVPRLEALFKSTEAAVLSSSVLFAAYHTYQGMAGTLCAFLMGLVYGSAFAVTRRIWPLVVAHTCWNIFVVLIRPLLRN